jgi:8-amino-7-oxononanoate synthase
VNVQPIIYPAVPENGARLRFFLSSLHEPAQLQNVARKIADTLATLAGETIDLGALTSKLSGAL